MCVRSQGRELCGDSAGSSGETEPGINGKQVVHPARSPASRHRALPVSEKGAEILWKATVKAEGGRSQPLTVKVATQLPVPPRDPDSTPRGALTVHFPMAGLWSYCPQKPYHV